jgi:diguanylate cyclase (GGDEF)-like protein
VEEVSRLLALVRALRVAGTLEDMLYAVTDATAHVLGVERVTLRLLDETRARLLLAARSGAPIHAGEVSFAMGEGLSGWVAEHDSPLLIDDAEADARFVQKPGQTKCIGSYLGVPLADSGGTIGVLSATHEQRARFSARDRDLATLIAGISDPWLQTARLRRLSLVDPLTSALNRRGLDSVFPAAGGQMPCVLLVDLDRFKSINDQYGHALGDRVLSAVAGTLADVARHADDVVRLGGEEFLIVLRGASLAAGERVAERARLAISELRWTAEGGAQVRLTASIGVARQRADESRDAVIARADRAMYTAKSRGRNAVVVDGEDEHGPSRPEAA